MMMRRAGLLLLLVLLVSVVAAVPAAAAPGWRSEQPAAVGTGVPGEIGEIGDIEFWAPNRGMLITAGNGGVPAGLFAFDGSGWYRYSTVCGGHEGRIAWAGPNDFWTISDQQAGQGTGMAPPRHISLCHFVNGAVVASYAEPVGVAGSYLPMDAAACAAPDDCWFAGERLPGRVNSGAFHLHWDGSSVTAIPSLIVRQLGLEDPGRSVTSLAYHQGGLYEGVEVRDGDVAPAEPSSEPSFLHQIVSQGGATAFVSLYPEDPVVSPEPSQLEGMRLASDGEELWAIAGALEFSAAMPAVLRLGAAGFEQVQLSGGVLGAGDSIRGIAAEPGSATVWVSFSESGDFSSPARLTRIHADGSVEEPTLLPAAGELIGHKGAAGPIACPAAEQCWMATQAGWLFHLGPDLPVDPDPTLHALITSRPPDASLPSVPPISLPEDNSGADSAKGSEPLPETLGEPLPKRRPALYGNVKSRLIGHSLLELTFSLHAKARVQLLAERKGEVVAKTPRLTMAKGERKLRLRLDPRRWPTKLDLRVQAIGGKSK
jgi:hypothetical protein